ncbi:hypothetical protein PSTT_06125 [Puccinia striiformis]|uniref:glutamate decarboxylase n=1 Tax=Puccinia striiformis TaxID=27350 RepID=A0A2S4VLA8_9BASI|nr:hypothetical protein PSTT_06125 [Puccinia striiformis]
MTTSREIPKFKLPSKGIEPETAYQLIHDILDLDGKENANLASFVHTWAPVSLVTRYLLHRRFASSSIADKEAVQLCVENLGKNLIDQDEYPQTQLGGLAMKKIWQAKRKAAGKSIHEPGPNIVMGANAQIFRCGMRLVPVSEETNYCLDPERAMEYVDENTIGVFVILGSTYTGHFEPVKPLSDLLDEYEAKTGIYVPIHVDGASGAFVAPFVYPDLEWDFRLPRVVSINTSGHKFGLTYVGCGWIVWRDQAHLPKELIFELHYLGSVEYSFSLNFSRPAHPIIHQYYNFVQLGFEGYRQIGLGDLANARLISRALEKSGYYKVISDIHRKKVDMGKSRDQVAGVSDLKFEEYVMGLPVVAFCWTDEFKNKHPHLKQSCVQIPNYELPPNMEDTQILRVVVRESMSPELIVCYLTCETSPDYRSKTADQGTTSGAVPKGKSHEHAFGNHQHEDVHKTARSVPKLFFSFLEQSTDVINSHVELSRWL